VPPGDLARPEGIGRARTTSVSKGPGQLEVGQTPRPWGYGRSPLPSPLRVSPGVEASSRLLLGSLDERLTEALVQAGATLLIGNLPVHLTGIVVHV
jgi:hypothetical protein